MMQANFDMDAAIHALRDGKDLVGKAGILTPLIKQITQSAMQVKLENHLQNDNSPVRKNCTRSKKRSKALLDPCASLKSRQLIN